MGLDLASWKAKVSEYLKPRAPLFKQAGADLIYGLLGANALLPIILTGGDLSAALVPMLGNIGAGLIVNMVQGWKDKTDEAVAREILGATQANAELRQTMDELLLKLEVIPAATQEFSRADRQWFLETLRTELSQIQSSIKIEIQTDGGAVIYGNVTVHNGDFVGRDKITYIINPPPADPGIPALHQLPDPPADFVGRAAELDELCAAVQTQGALICGLTGLGGVGKTALGLVLASQLKAHYPDGQLYIYLRGASDKPLTPAAALEQLIRAFAPVARLPEDVEQLAAIYRTLLAGKQILVFLDDARDAAQVRALLPPRPALAIVTSRRRFDLAGYHTRDVSALPLDDAEKLICAVWGQTGEVTALAQRCGCLPMALRAAGALLKKPGMTPEFVNNKLAAAYERLKLADPQRDNLTVAAAFQASYDQLSPDLQRYWRSLGIFPADFNAKAADAVWRTEDAPAALTQVLSVFDRLLTSTSAPKPPDAWEVLSELQSACLVDYTGGRWRLHDLARDFTRALCPPAELDALAYRHAAYYQKVLYACRDLYMKGNENILAGLALFDRERANIEAGQAWAAAHPADPAAARLCNLYPDAGVYVIELRLHPLAQIAWLEVALTAARALGNREYEGYHLGNLGSAWADLGEPRRAIEYHEQALVIDREIGDRRGEGQDLGNLGLAWAALGEPHRAIEYHEQALVVMRELGDKRAEGSILGNLGNAYKDLGEPRRAIDYYEQDLVIAREIGDRRGEGAALGNLGNAYQNLGEPRRAIDYYEQHLVIAREIGDRRGEGNALGNLGNAWADLGELRRAIDYYEQALVIDREIGDRRGEGQHLGNLGNAWADLGEPRRAIEYHEQALVIDREIGDRRGEGAALGNLGNAWYLLGEPRRAIDYHEQALVVMRELGDKRAEGSILGNLGNAWADLGEPRRAIDYYEQQLVITRQIGDRLGEANACWNLGLLLEQQGELPRAVELMQVRVDFLRAIGHPDAEKAEAYVEQTRQKLK